MKCQCVDNSMDQISPSGEIPAQLGDHLEDCSDCKEAVEKWRHVQRELQELDKENTPERQIPIETSTQKILTQAIRESNRRVSAKWRRALPLAASFLLISGAAALYLAQPEKTPSIATPSQHSPSQVATLILDGEVRTAPVEQISEALGAPQSESSLLQLNNDTVGIDKNSRLHIDQASPQRTRLRLEQGRIACRVFHRSPTENFEIRGGPFVVRVTGTQFSVSRRGPEQLEVAVWEGEVEVSRDLKKWAVKKGTQLVISASQEPSLSPLSEENQTELKLLLDPKAEHAETPAIALDSDMEQDDKGHEEAVGPARSRPPKADLAAWRSWILEGRYKKACRSLRQHLKSNSDDSAAWSLLSDCARKQGRWNEALSAYREIIATETFAKKRRAQYRAGAIYQDHLGKPAAAARLYEQYLASGATTSLIRAEAMVRLARAYIDMGQRKKAKGVLDTVVREHRGTTAAREAKDMLESLKRPLVP